MNNACDGAVVICKVGEKDGKLFTHSYSTFCPSRRLEVVWKSTIDFGWLLWYYSNSQEGYPSLPILEIAFWDGV